MNERILGLDIGDARIGVAVSDPSRTIATPLEVIQRKGWGPDVRRIAELCRLHETGLVVSGLPLNMDGSAGFQSEKVKQFCQQLEKAGLTVYYQDERLTTVSAERSLLSGDVSRQERKRRVDKVAAAIILQQWLDTQKAEREEQAMTDDMDRMGPEDEDFVDEEQGIIELIDEDGQTVSFVHLDTVEHDGEYYIVLLPADEEDADEDEDGAGVLIMRISKDENGEDCYVAIDDEAVLDAVFNKFLERVQEDEDYEVGPASDDDE